MSIMEAVSFGIPVVASDVGGTSEIVNSDLGILFPKDITPQQLKSIILRFSDFDEKTVLELRKSARVEWEKMEYGFQLYKFCGFHCKSLRSLTKSLPNSFLNILKVVGPCLFLVDFLYKL